MIPGNFLGMHSSTIEDKDNDEGFEVNEGGLFYKCVIWNLREELSYIDSLKLFKYFYIGFEKLHICWGRISFNPSNFLSFFTFRFSFKVWNVVEEQVDVKILLLVKMLFGFPIFPLLYVHSQFFFDFSNKGFFLRFILFDFSTRELLDNQPFFYFLSAVNVDGRRPN